MDLVHIVQAFPGFACIQIYNECEVHQLVLLPINQKMTKGELSANELTARFLTTIDSTILSMGQTSVVAKR